MVKGNVALDDGGVVSQRSKVPGFCARSVGTFGGQHVLRRSLDVNAGTRFPRRSQATTRKSFKIENEGNRHLVHISEPCWNKVISVRDKKARAGRLLPGGLLYSR